MVDNSNSSIPPPIHIMVGVIAKCFGVVTSGVTVDTNGVTTSGCNTVAGIIAGVGGVTICVVGRG